MKSEQKKEQIQKKYMRPSLDFHCCSVQMNDGQGWAQLPPKIVSVRSGLSGKTRGAGQVTATEMLVRGVRVEDAQLV